MITLEELRKLSEKELDSELVKTSQDLLKLRLGISVKQSTETDKIKRLKRYVARIRTLKNFLKKDQLNSIPAIKASVTK